MIENIEIISGGKYKVEDSLKKYAAKRISKLDRFLPIRHRRGASAKVVVKEINRPHGNKYEISVALDVPGGRVMAARDEASNVFAGIDILEAKLLSQIRKFKLQEIPHKRKPKKGVFRKIFFK